MNCKAKISYEEVRDLRYSTEQEARRASENLEATLSQEQFYLFQEAMYRQWNRAEAYNCFCIMKTNGAKAIESGLLIK